MNGLAKLLMAIGALLFAAGALIWGIGALFPSLGRLPGDLTVVRKNVTIFFPFTTMIIVSIALTIILNLLGRWMK